MVTSFFKDSVGVFIAFAIDDLSSFESVNRWMSLIKDNCETEVDILLLGTKADLFEERKVPLEAAKELAQKYGCFYLETSAKQDDSEKGRVEEAFEVLVTLSHLKMRGGNDQKKDGLSIQTEGRKNKEISQLNDNVSEKSANKNSDCC